MQDQKIVTYVVNLRNRVDRRAHILNEFNKRGEFAVEIVPAVEQKLGSVGLWMTIRCIVENAAQTDAEYILICEDDHQFTGEYSRNFLLKCIAEAKLRDADILLGGVSSVHSLFKTSDSLLWIEGYTGNQFVIVFKQFFQTILTANFETFDSADYKFSALSQRLFLIYPFISTQREFGYSDVTALNGEIGRVDRLFANASRSIQYLIDGANFYGFNQNRNDSRQQTFAEVVLPTYIVNLLRQEGSWSRIRAQFAAKNEFDVTYLKQKTACLEADTAWFEVKKAILTGIRNDDDFLILCDARHVFSESYSPHILILNIVEAHQQGADILLGGTERIGGGFAHALPIGNNLFWINHFNATHFLIIYRKFFQRILDAQYDSAIGLGDFLSGLTSNKMLVYPYISNMDNFPNSSGVSESLGEEKMVLWMFEDASNRLHKIHDAYMRYGTGITHQSVRKEKIRHR